MTDPRPLRSALYLPASNARAIAKARTLPCDAIILDLEDAVAPDAKALARAQAVAAVRAGGWGRRRVVVRVNGAGTPWGADDLAALAGVAVDAVLLPKVDGAADARPARAALGTTPLWAMIESPRAVLDVAAIAASGCFAGFVLGVNDLAVAMRVPLAPGRAPFLPLLSLAVAATRAHGLAVLDGVWNALDDEAGLAAECAQGAAWGFDGKTVIHPGQIAAANAAFAPAAAAVAEARAIVAAFADPAAAGLGAIRLGGRMVERLHLAAAERLLARAAAIAAGDATA